jgi:hypothetical protein
LFWLGATIMIIFLISGFCYLKEKYCKFEPTTASEDGVLINNSSNFNWKNYWLIIRFLIFYIFFYLDKNKIWIRATFKFLFHSSMINFTIYYYRLKFRQSNVGYELDLLLAFLDILNMILVVSDINWWNF